MGNYIKFKELKRGHNIYMINPYVAAENLRNRGLIGFKTKNPIQSSSLIDIDISLLSEWMTLTYELPHRQLAAVGGGEVKRPTATIKVQKESITAIHLSRGGAPVIYATSPDILKSLLDYTWEE